MLGERGLVIVANHQLARGTCGRRGFGERGDASAGRHQLGMADDEEEPIVAQRQEVAGHLAHRSCIVDPDLIEAFVLDETIDEHGGSTGPGDGFQGGLRCGGRHQDKAVGAPCQEGFDPLQLDHGIAVGQDLHHAEPEPARDLLEGFRQGREIGARGQGHAQAHDARAPAPQALGQPVHAKAELARGGLDAGTARLADLGRAVQDVRDRADRDAGSACDIQDGRSATRQHLRPVSALARDGQS